LVAWTKAVAAAQKAHGLLEPGLDPALLAQVESLLDTVTAEKSEAESVARAAESEHIVVDKLVDIRSAKADDPDGSMTDAAYADAFREAGIDVAAQPPAEVGARIKVRASAVAAALTAALDDWSSVRRLRRSDRPGALRLVQVANAADPDSWRVGLRRAIDLSDRVSRAKALRDLAASTNPETAPAVDLNLLGTALSEIGEASAAEDMLRTGCRRFRDDVWLNFDLARLLEQQSRGEEAIRYYSIARALRPETAHNLAHALEARGESVEALAVFEDLVQLRRDVGRHWACYGRLLKERGDRLKSIIALETAVAILSEKVRLKPDDAPSHSNFGIALDEQGKVVEAIAAYREAIRLKPDFAEAHHNLANVLKAQGKLAEAIAAYREAIRLRPDYARTHSDLGIVLMAQGKVAEAIAEFREAIRLKPDFALAHTNLGAALFEAKHEYVRAEAEFRTAIRLKPDYALAHTNLGNALKAQGKVGEATAEFREAIRLKPDYAEAYCNLGLALPRQGRFREAFDELRKGHELGSRRPGWPYLSAEWVRQAERLAALELRLSAVLRGEDKPKDAAEGLVFADMAYKARRYGMSARLYVKAFEADPKLAEDMRSSHRYNAACAAVRAGGVRAEDKPPPDEKEKGLWRKQAVRWLRADLAVRTKQVESGPKQAKALVGQTLRHWKMDADLASIRDEDELRGLPEDERKAYRTLWTDVDALLERAESVIKKR
jgi:tetratricopeptide (TPR) repeat protein